MDTTDDITRPAFGKKDAMIDREPETFAIYIQILEDTFGKIDDRPGDPAQQDALLYSMDGSNSEFHKDEDDGTGVKDNTRRRLRRIHTHRRRSKRH